MKKTIRITFLMIIFLTVITGIIYPLFVTGISRVFLHEKAGGSLVRKDGIVVGSRLIGQQFDSPLYFHPRPSAVDYQSLPSGASNLSWTDKRLVGLVELRKEDFLRDNGLADTTLVPVEMLFSSGSGLDPHISPQAARLQLERVAVARNYNGEQKQLLSALVDRLTEEPQYSLFGEARINVLLLNLELDKIR
jgi:potassium-transporting ATPase KdpC subunit